MCKTQPNDKIILLCSRKFTESYCKMLEDNRNSCQRLMVDGRSDKTKGFSKRVYFTQKLDGYYKGKFLEHAYDPLFSDLQTKQRMNTKAFRQKQVIIGGTDCFLEALNILAQKFDRKKRCQTQKETSETACLVMKTHMVIDDFDVREVCESTLNPLSLLTSNKCLIWLVTDIHQSKLPKKPKLMCMELMSSKSVEVFILEEVLRNTVQINQKTHRLVECMNDKLEDDGQVSPGT